MRHITKSLAVVLLVGAAGCGGGGDGPGVATLDERARPSATPKADQALAAEGTRSDDPAAAAQAYTRCLRTHGLPNYPGAQPSKDGLTTAIPFPWKDSGFGRNAPQVLRAARACARERGAVFGPPDAAALERLRKQVTAQAACMRRQPGFSDYPDPEVFDTGVVDDHLPRGTEERPGWSKAYDACANAR